GEKRVFLVILFTSFSGSLVSLREFSLQDSRGGSRIAENHVYPAMIRIDYGQDFFIQHGRNAQKNM
ncbi:TPA: hypothetical protein ACIIU1_005085, partial [Escherichia coli]